MTIDTFDKITASLNAARKAIVDAKRPEYTEGRTDVLHNFKIVANELGITPLQVWYIYFRKHVASIGQYCANPDRRLAEPITERICDAMNYLELLNGLLEDLALASNSNFDNN